MSSEKAVVLPSHYKLDLTSKTIEEGTVKVASEINSWAQTGEFIESEIVAVCILRGGVFFFADLVRKLDFSLYLEFVSFSSYDEASNTQKSAKDLKEFSYPFNPKGKRIILVDDILETGRTLEILSKKLIELGAVEVLTAVMVYRNTEETESIPNFYATEINHKTWLAGMGLDDSGLQRNLPNIYRIN